MGNQTILIQSNPNKAASWTHAHKPNQLPPQLLIYSTLPDNQGTEDAGNRARRMPEHVKNKHDEPIKKGDEVYTRIRGGRHEGEVDKIVTSQAQAEKEAVKNPPKVSQSV